MGRCVGHPAFLHSSAACWEQEDVSYITGRIHRSGVREGWDKPYAIPEGTAEKTTPGLLCKECGMFTSVPSGVSWVRSKISSGMCETSRFTPMLGDTLPPRVQQRRDKAEHEPVTHSDDSIRSSAPPAAVTDLLPPGNYLRINHTLCVQINRRPQRAALRGGPLINTALQE